MRSEDYVDRIINYLFKTPIKRALLINGPWGCGKTHFVNNHLIKALESHDIDGKKMKVVRISLFGLSSNSEIQNSIYSRFLETLFFSNKGRGKVAHSILKNISLFGVATLNAVGTFIRIGGIGDPTKNIVGGVSKDVIKYNHGNTVLIFDDLERCKVGIVEVMGLLNNLCENEGYHVIVIANDDVIENRVNEIANTINLQTAVLAAHIDGHITDDQTEPMNHLNRGAAQNGSKRVTSGEVKDIYKKNIEVFLGDELAYEKTREKLFGLVLQYKVDVEEIFPSILEATVKSTSIREYITKNKDLYLDVFETELKSNLRTLISSLVASEFVLEIYNNKIEGSFDNDELLGKEKIRLIDYIICSVARYSKMKETLHDWGKLDYGIVELGYQYKGKRSIFGYRFIDEYWDSSYVSEDKAVESISKLLKEKENELKNSREVEEHKNLSLYKLNEWYIEEDSVVKDQIKSMKDELGRRMYYPYEFKDIILILMRINNPNFGMTIEDGKIIGNQSDEIFEPVENSDIQPIESKKEEQIDAGGAYESWDSVNIEEFVNLMVKYFVDPSFTMTRDMLRVISDDKKFAQEYKHHIMPLLERIDDEEVKALRETDDGQNVFIKWDSDLVDFCREHKNDYYERGRFLSLYNGIKEKIKSANSEELFTFCDAVKIVYSFSNLRDVFKDDDRVVNEIYEKLRVDRENGGRKTFNELKSRTKEIALRRLENDFKRYTDRLRNPQDIVNQQEENTNE